MAEWLSAQEAADRLGISKQTLYAYVSRGRLSSSAGPGPTRARRYPAEAVERLAAERSVTRQERAAAATMDWGLPVLDSALTLIEDGRLYYRGRDAVTLATTTSLEDVAALLWEVPEVVVPATSMPATPIAADPVRVLIRDVAARSADGFGAARMGRSTHVRHAAGLLARVFDAIGAGGDGPLAERLARSLGTSDVTAVSRALVLCADHELNVSAFTARCVASAEASLDEAVLGALCAFNGLRHGAASHRMWRLLREADTDGVAVALRRVVAETGAVPGLGHPLYPDGDPRAAALIERVDAAADPMLGELLRLAETEFDAAPNLDLGLAMFAWRLGLPEAAPQAVFALGRIVGWIAHVFESWSDGALIRPRARYVGLPPSGEDGP